MPASTECSCVDVCELQLCYLCADTPVQPADTGGSAVCIGIYAATGGRAAIHRDRKGTLVTT